MKVSIEGRRATVELEDYPDLLTVRTLPEYSFVGDATVECDAEDLADAGIVPARTAKRWRLAPHLFDFQAWIVRRALTRERFALFSLTGTGKTAMQLEWARQVTKIHGGRTLIVAPLGVCAQTVREATKFYGGRFEVADLTDRARLDEWLATGKGVGITNYEKIDSAARTTRYEQAARWPVDAVILDESSMLRSFGPRKFAVQAAFDGCRWKLACSATPAPNQRTEFAQHAVFLGQVRSTTEYLTAYFVNRDGDWQPKPHGYEAWVANLAGWAVFLRDPARWGFTGMTGQMPGLEEVFPDITLTHEQAGEAREWEAGDQPSLFGATPGGITSRTKMAQIANGFILEGGELQRTIPSAKPQWIADLVNGPHAADRVIVWVKYRYEGEQLARLIPDAMELNGATARPRRDAAIEAFAAGRDDAPRVLVAMQQMFSHGLNLQSCRVQVFSTQDDNFEARFQAIRRSYRFGQSERVVVYTPLTPLDRAACDNTLAKAAAFEADSRALEDSMVSRLRPRDTSERIVMSATPAVELDRQEGQSWTLVHGDCLAHMPTMADGSVDLAVFSPPFAALYAYSKELGDMGNTRADAEFRLQWRWFAERLLRVMRPGRIVAVHCKEIIRFANSHGHRHAYDFPAELRQGMEDAGFYYHRRITIAKNPQLEATRNKETSLLHVTAIRDAADSYPQTGEYLMVFAAPGKNPEPIVHTREVHTFERHTTWMNSIWPEPSTPAEGEAEMWAADAQAWLDAYHPDRHGAAWNGIRETDVLNAALGKETAEEKHVCPLQLGLIERVVELWSNPGELVFTPFGGIGSELVTAIKLGRRAYGVELKRSYFDTAARICAATEAKKRSTQSLFTAHGSAA